MFSKLNCKWGPKNEIGFNQMSKEQQERRVEIKGPRQEEKVLVDKIAHQNKIKAQKTTRIQRAKRTQ